MHLPREEGTCTITKLSAMTNFFRQKSLFRMFKAREDQISALTFLYIPLRPPLMQLKNRSWRYSIETITAMRLSQAYPNRSNRQDIQNAAQHRAVLCRGIGENKDGRLPAWWLQCQLQTTHRKLRAVTTSADGESACCAGKCSSIRKGSDRPETWYQLQKQNQTVKRQLIIL